MTTFTLTSNEIVVLARCIESSAGNGYAFGFTDEVTRGDHAIAGTIGSLAAKGIIQVDDESVRDITSEGSASDHQFYLADAIFKSLRRHGR